MRSIILIILAAGFIPAVLKRPLLGLAIYLGANIVRPEMFFWGGSGGSFVFKLYFAVVFLACWCNGYFGRLREVVHREYLLMLAFLAAVVISAAASQYEAPRQSYFISELVKGFSFVALVYLCVTKASDIYRIEAILIGCFAFLGVWGLQQSLLGNERLEGLGGNAWGDSNCVAAMFVLFLPVVLALLSNADTRKKKILLIGVGAVMVALIICTRSRGGLTGLITCIVAYGYFARRLSKVVLLGGLCVVLLIPTLSESYLERMKTMTSVSDSDDFEGSARSRLILWKAGMMVFADHPVLGTGFMTYPEAKMEYEHRFDYLDDTFRKWVFRTENKKVTHNTYVQILSECGILGAVPFFLLVALTIGKGIRARRLLAQVGQTPELLWVASLSAGVAGFAVCQITMDLGITLILYVQIALIFMLDRFVAGSPASTAAEYPKECVSVPAM